MSKWIQKANIKKGGLHKALNIPEGKKIPAKKLVIKESDSPKIKKMKVLAKTFKKMHK